MVVTQRNSAKSAFECVAVFFSFAYRLFLMRIFKNAWFSRFARKQGIPDLILRDAVRRADEGQIDADYGGGVIKQRVARPGRGKSMGYRVLLLFRQGERAFFVYGFSKADRANIGGDEEEQFKKMAGPVLALTDAQIERLIATGQFEEVGGDDDEISE